MKDKEFLIQNGINVDKSLELFGDMETYNETLKVFIEEIKSKKDNLKKYKEVSDMANYAIYAHSVKSDARYFGFETLTALALNHEMAGKNNDMYYVTEHYSEFMNEILRIERIVNEYMNIPIEYLDEEVVIRDEVILVVDDSLVIKKFIESIFHDKYQVVMASDGNEAINLLNSNSKIDKMLLDLNMPNVNGFDVLNYMLANDLFKKVAVTVITGIDDRTIMEGAKRYPIKGFLLKPFNERDIKDAVEGESIL